jgi:hypothetical protein
VGIPQAAQCPSVRAWKEAELEMPFARTVFGRLRLQHVIGRTGSVRARVIVVGIFLLSLLIPLQLALNQLALEFRTRQAISRAQAVFDVRNRSTVINSSFTFGDDVVDVHIQVATNDLFTAEDIARFEERVSDQSGRRARLDLVQTVSDIGQADTIRRLLSGQGAVTAPPRPGTVSESLRDVGALVRQILAELPLPDALHIIAVRGDLTGATGPAIELVYLADSELGTDARTMLVRLLASRTRVSEPRLTLRWLPAMWTVRLSRRGVVDPGDEDALHDLGVMLTEQPDLGVILELPAGMSATAQDSVRQQVQRRIGVAELSVVVAPAGISPGAAILRVSTGLRRP